MKVRRPTPRGRVGENLMAGLVEEENVVRAEVRAVESWDMSFRLPMRPRPPARETAVARGAQAKPPIGAEMMRGVVVQGR